MGRNGASAVLGDAGLDEESNGWLHELDPVEPYFGTSNHENGVSAQKRDTMASPSSIEPSPTEYRRFADECLRWADRVPRQDQKNTLVEMAKVWMHAALMMEYDHAHEGPPRDAQVP
jgi:hypothetical protein